MKKTTLTLQVIFTTYFTSIIYNLVIHYSTPSMCPPNVLCHEGSVVPALFSFVNLILNFIFFIGYLIFEFDFFKKESYRTILIILLVLLVLRTVSYLGYMYISSMPNTF